MFSKLNTTVGQKRGHWTVTKFMEYGISYQSLTILIVNPWPCGPVGGNRQQYTTFGRLVIDELFPRAIRYSIQARTLQLCCQNLVVQGRRLDDCATKPLSTQTFPSLFLSNVYCKLMDKEDWLRNRMAFSLASAVLTIRDESLCYIFVPHIYS